MRCCPAALAAFVLGAVETSAIGRMFAQKHGYRFDANRELLAIGAGNLFAGLGRGFPVSGGMSQSLVNESAGAQTPISGLIAALFTLVVVLFASGLLRNLPQPVLAAVVLAAIVSLVDVHALREIWRFSRTEFLVAMAALLGVLGSGPANGVLLGAAISIVLLLQAGIAAAGHRAGARARHAPHSATARAIPSTSARRACSWSAASRRWSTSTSSTPAIASCRSWRRAPTPCGLVILFLGSVPNVDLAGAELIRDLHNTLAGRGIAHAPGRGARAGAGRAAPDRVRARARHARDRAKPWT